ncbi:MAG: histidine kinase [Rhodobacteraceae bacterium]|nr:histidine kinase [Paracoccaceae bacterium]
MNGRIVAGGLVSVALLAGAAMYWLQVYVFYEPIAGAAIALTPVGGRAPQPVAVAGFEGIDSESSPVRFRACFHLDMSLATLTETYAIYPEPVPLVAPGWFRCFDAGAIGAALEAGEAVAFLGEAEIRPGVDRIVAVFPDGRAFAWHQLNARLRN